MTRPKGKKIDTLNLTHEGVSIKVPLYMYKSEGGALKFWGEIKEIGFRFDDESADKVYSKTD